MAIYRFEATIRCFLANGEEHVLRGYEVVVEADSPRQAYDAVEQIATEQVHDAGSKLLDAPLEHLEVLFCSTP